MGERKYRELAKYRHAHFPPPMGFFFFFFVVTVFLWLPGKSLEYKQAWQSGQ